jgi:hypothetical protein
MAPDDARAVPQPVLDRGAHDIALPAPRPPVLERAGQAAPRPDPEPVAPETARPAPRPVHESHAGWIVPAVAAVAAAWAVGWIAGVSWAWRAMTPRYLSHRRRVSGLPASFGPGE